MTKRVLLVVGLLGGLVALNLIGCGTSGSNPVELAEVHFQVTPDAGGVATFTVPLLFASGLKHLFPDTEFTATAPFNIVFEGASPPYGGSFQRAPDSADVTVQLSVMPTGGKNEITVQANTTPSDDTASVTIPAGAVPPSSASPGVRFEVCAPSTSGAACITSTDSGIFGVPFSGTVGDAFSTRLLGGANVNVLPVTPTIYFLEAARDSVNAVFRSQAGQLLQVQLFIDGELRQTKTGTGDLVIREDL